MDEIRATYGTTSEAVITLIAATGEEKTIRLPNPKDTSSIVAPATSFAALATNSDTAVIGIKVGDELVVPASIRVDVVTTTRTNVYGGEG